MRGATKGIVQAINANGGGTEPFVGTCANRGVRVRREARAAEWIVESGRAARVARCQCGLLVFGD